MTGIAGKLVSGSRSHLERAVGETDTDGRWNEPTRGKRASTDTIMKHRERASAGFVSEPIQNGAQRPSDHRRNWPAGPDGGNR